MKKTIKRQIQKSKFLTYFELKIRKIFDKEDFFKVVKGVIHVGANTGQERDIYKGYKLAVIWIEPITEIFYQLKNNISGYDKQKAYQYLITDTDNKEYDFHIANNEGESSSIFELKHHVDIWPEVKFDRKTVLKSMTLASFLDVEDITIKHYDALIMDTQGAELLVLKGAGEFLKHFKYIKAEVADFEAYKGCCQTHDIKSYLSKFGFKVFHKGLFASRKDGGNYYDIIYKKVR